MMYDNIMILPGYSEIEHRSDCDVSTRFTKNYKMALPLVSAPMDTITEEDMAYAMARKGGVGVIHRFMPIEEQIKKVRFVQQKLGKALTSAAV